MKVFIARTFAVALVLILSATGLWAGAGTEEAPAAAMEKEMVTDPTTGKMVTAPQYGGTLTFPYALIGETTDPFFTGGYAGMLIGGVNQNLAVPNWGLDRKEFAFNGPNVPLFTWTEELAESWEQPDPLTYIINVRQGVHYALDPDSEASRLVGGRELTADDVVFNFHRQLVMGDFTEPPQETKQASFLPWESIEATDKYTVVMKLTEPNLDALQLIVTEVGFWILPPEVIEKYGDYTDWKNVVGTGPMMLTDYVEGVSKTWTKNPDYWGYDEKFPENRLPYLDKLVGLYMAEEATRLSALRSGKIDMTRLSGAEIQSIDVVKSLQRTNPELEVWPFYQRSLDAIILNIRKPPFDDIRVRHALQMALDQETINDTYFGGFADWHPPRYIGTKGYYTEWEEWPAELKGYYTYDPEGAERLLDEAGYPRGADGVRFKFEHVHRDVGDLGYVEIVAGYWADIGVDASIRVTDWATIAAAKTEHDYESIYGYMAIESPGWAMGHYNAGLLWRRAHLGAGVESPVLAAAHAAYHGATSVDEQMKAAKEFGMEAIKQHFQIWGPLAPRYQHSHPWVKGFNGETLNTVMHEQSVLVRLWIDSELKESMGY
ncbi:MAG: ABC transporter substrate-binding protein [Spirochaetaceae bacterium]|nr:ABC transporter substrate-binding protein [Spirochaetaceae bacterium]